MGKPALDYHVCFKGFYAAVETKRPGQTFTRRQARTARDVLKAGGSVFLVDSEAGQGMQDLCSWLLDPKPGVITLHTATHLAAHYIDGKWENGNERHESSDDRFGDIEHPE